MLTDLIEFQQRKHVKGSTGELAHECFTDLDFASFKSARTPARVAARLAEAPDFHVIANALRAIPAERLVEVMRAARQKARPTWRQMGFIDRQGRGQTEAGHQAELMIADSIVNAFAVDLNVRPWTRLRQARRSHRRGDCRRSGVDGSFWPFVH
jgi:hypothetical protein